MQKRKLSKFEIESLCEGIKTKLPNDFTTENIKAQLYAQLQTVEIYPSQIPKLKSIIQEQYEHSCITPGEMVGCIASTSIGETTTQQSLNSVVYTTRCLLLVDGQTRDVCLGEYIDNCMNQTNYSNVVYGGFNTSGRACIAHVHNTNIPTFIQTIDHKGNVSCKRITQLIRHPLVTGLLNITLRSGRNFTVTTGESCLIYQNRRVSPIQAKDLQIGDLIPVSHQSPDYPIQEYINVPWSFTPVKCDYSLGLLVGSILLSGQIIDHPKLFHPLMNSLTAYFDFNNIPYIYEKSTDDSQKIARDCLFPLSSFTDWVHSFFGWNPTLKHLPDFCYQAPDVFVMGILSGLGCFQSRKLTVQSYRFAQGLAHLCSRFGMFVTYNQSISGWDCEIVKNCSKQFRNVGKFCVYDKIKYIAPIVDYTHPYVYDCTVEDTANFSTLCNVHLRDSFHQSGALKVGLTSGVARLQELLNASKTIKTPSLTIYFRPEMVQVENLSAVRHFAHTKLQQVLLGQCIKSVDYEIQPITDPWYEGWKNLYSEDYLSCDTRCRLKLDLSMLVLHQITLEQIVFKLETECASRDTCIFVFSPLFLGIIDIWVDSESVPDVDSILHPKNYSDEERAKVQEYIEPNKGTLFLKRSVFPTIQKLLLSGCTGLEKCYYSQTKGVWNIETKGGTMKECTRFPEIDISRLVSNNMWEILECLGVEATVQFLYNDFSKQLRVNKRHLDIMIDWMTNRGFISSVNRYGMDIGKVGPFAKASFEQPLDAFFDAAHNAQVDNILGVSAAIATGKMGKLGTGSFELLLDTDMVTAYAVEEQEDEKLVYISEEIGPEEETLEVVEEEPEEECMEEDDGI